jgi:hypothetical protein
LPPPGLELQPLSWPALSQLPYQLRYPGYSDTYSKENKKKSSHLEESMDNLKGKVTTPSDEIHQLITILVIILLIFVFQ